MKLIFKLIKRACIGLFTIYSINVLFSSLHIIIPINLITIGLSMFLGIYGLFAIILLQFVI